MSQLTRRALTNEPNDFYDLPPRRRLQQRQQQEPSILRQQQYPAFSSSSGSPSRSLRRTSPFQEQQLPRARSRSFDSASRRPANVRFAQSPDSISRQRASSTSRVSDPSKQVHPALQISHGTSQAILYALEIGLRNPNPFTPDLAEENASMSDLVRGGRASNGGPRGAQGRSAATGQIKTPTEIMKDRRAREAAKEARERGQAEPEPAYQPTSQDEDRIRAAERRFAAAGVAAQPPRDSGYRSQGPSVGGRTPADPSYPTPTLQASSENRRSEQPSQTYGPESNIPTAYSTSAQESARPRGQQPTYESQYQQPVTSSTRAQPLSTQPKNPPTTGVSQAAPAQQARTTTGSGTSEGASRRRSNVSSFPHAFERWETLSSRWEGLTSYWIHRLERNTEEIRRDPERQQMSRQITDLSAAGANLFHAVVELQRLRASSERKFQRWFFETRDQQLQAQETQENLQRMLEQERRATADEVRTSQRLRTNEKLIEEYRRELQISKDEARRAWEELGRREQAERERVMSLREGFPVEIGGVQVVPTSSASRGGAVPQPSGQPSGYQSQLTPARAAQAGDQGYQYASQQDTSPTDTDPYSGRDRAAQPVAGTVAGAASGQFPPRVSSTRATTSGAGTSSNPTAHYSRGQPMDGSRDSPSARFYTQPNTFLQGPGASTATGPAFSGSESDDDPGYEIDDEGHVRFDTSGNPIPSRGMVPFTSSATTSARQEPIAGESERDRFRAPTQGRSSTTEQTQSGRDTGQAFDDPADYEGAGYGASETGWEDMPPAQPHHHPTRLSDVLEEEDERSRTSGRASRGSGGIY